MEITFFGFCSNHLHEGSGGAPRKCPMRRGASVSPLVYIIKKIAVFLSSSDSKYPYYGDYFACSDVFSFLVCRLCLFASVKPFEIRLPYSIKCWYIISAAARITFIYLFEPLTCTDRHLHGQTPAWTDSRVATHRRPSGVPRRTTVE